MKISLIEGQLRVLLMYTKTFEVSLVRLILYSK